MPQIVLGPGVRVHRTLQTLFLTAEPMRILEYNPRRLWASIITGYNNQTSPPLANTEQECVNGDAPIIIQSGIYEVYGPEELWAWGDAPGSSPGNLVVQTLLLVE